MAITRAKTNLLFSFTRQKIDAKNSDLHPTRFLIEITGGEKIPETEIAHGKLLLTEQKLLARTRPPVLNISESNWLRKQVENFKFSPTTLYDILDCGLKFYFDRIVRVPSAPAASLGYGSAVHQTLNRLVDSGVNKKIWPDENTLVSWFEFEMFKKRSDFTRISYETRLKQGREQLPRYYQARKDEFRSYEVVVMERWMETSIEDVIIGGKSDKLIFRGNDVTVVDYKTGNAKNAEKKFKSPSPRSMEEGKLPHKYWFQLGIYMLIINQQAGKNWRAVMAVIDSLEPDENGEFAQFKQTWNEDELNYLRSFIREGNRRLKQFEFLTGCGKPDCEWCAFARETGQSVNIPDTEAEREIA